MHCTHGVRIQEDPGGSGRKLFRGRLRGEEVPPISARARLCPEHRREELPSVEKIALQTAASDGGTLGEPPSL
jgi:hypothetical protein